MAQKTCQLIALILLSFQWAVAQGPVVTPQKEKTKEAPLEMSPQFKANLERWNKLSKAQQEELRQREKARSERILNEINEAIVQSGLKLDATQRQIFTYRYAQERRSIEDRIQKEMEQKRREAISKLIRQLTEEFQPMPPPPPHPGPVDEGPTSIPAEATK